MRKIIDSKGRLFGIINIFDLFILLMIASAAFFTFKWMTISEDPSWVKVDLQDTYCIVVMETQPFIAEIVKEGDKSLNRAGSVLASIEKIMSNEPVQASVYYTNTGEKIFFNSEHRRLTLLMKVSTYKNRGEVYILATSGVLKIGSSFEMNTKKYAINVLVRKILEPGDEKAVQRYYK